MLSQSVRVSCSSLARLARQRQALLSHRTFIVPTAVRQADLLQELYLKELKAYKPTPIKSSDAEAHVQKWATPPPPKPPVEDNIAEDLKAYEQQVVEVEGQAQPGQASAKEDDWFEEEEEGEHASGH